MPCTGSTITAAVLRVTCAATASESPRGMKLTSKGVRGKPYHLSRAPQVTAAGGGGAAVEAALDGGDVLAAASCAAPS